MARVLIIAEKSSAADNFAKALGGKKGNYAGDDYIIVPASGHLYEFKSPEKQVSSDLEDTYKSWNLANLPWNYDDIKWERKISKGRTGKSQAPKIEMFKQAAKVCDEICIATDDDPTGEGQLIGWEIIHEAKLIAPKYTRMYFGDESVPKLQKAFKERKTLKPMNQDPDYIKSYYRTRADFLSMQFSRIATNAGDGQTLLRQGRLKSVMTALVGDQFDAISKYVETINYQNRFKDDLGNVYEWDEEPRYENESDVPQTYNQSSVTTDSKTRKKTAPPKLPALDGMSSKLSKKYSADQFSKTYQKMYEDLMVSYPRTEDTHITLEQFNELSPVIDKIAAVVGLDVSKLTHREPRMKTHIKEGMAHGANRPGYQNVPSSLDAVEAAYGKCGRDIYDMLAKAYLQMLMADYEYDQFKAHVTDYPDFVAKISVPAVLGWKEYGQVDDNDSDDESTGKGVGSVANPYVHTLKSQPPTKPSQKWLLKQLAKAGIGTGATRLSTFIDVTNTKVKHHQMAVTKGTVKLTDAGELSYKVIQGTNIASIEMTKQLQQEMKDVAEGTQDPEALLRAYEKYVKEDLVTMVNNGSSIEKTGGMAANQKEKYACTFNGNPATFNREWGGYRFTDEECNILANGGEVTITTAKGFLTRGKLQQGSYKGKPFLGFSNDGIVPLQGFGKVFTEEERAALATKKPVFMRGFVSNKTNKNFDAGIIYDGAKLSLDFNFKG